MSESEIFNGRAGEMRVSPWLAAEDIRGFGDQTVTIEQVYIHRNVEFEKGRSKPKAYALKFVGKTRQLLDNAARRKVLVDARGLDVTNWVGCSVTMYVDESVKMKGVAVGGIRFRPEVIPPDEQQKTDVLMDGDCSKSGGGADA